MTKRSLIHVIVREGPNILMNIQDVREQGAGSLCSWRNCSSSKVGNFGDEPVIPRSHHWMSKKFLQSVSSPFSAQIHNSSAPTWADVMILSGTQAWAPAKWLVGETTMNHYKIALSVHAVVKRNCCKIGSIVTWCKSFLKVPYHMGNQRCKQNNRVIHLSSQCLKAYISRLVPIL